MMILLEQAIAAAVGVAAHLFYFKSGEHHFHGLRYIQLLAITVVVGILGIRSQGEPSWQNAIHQVLTLCSCFLGGLYTSLIVYRAFFHPLNSFPGPYGARLSNFWLSAHLKDGHAYRKVAELHAEYGDFVRVGSSDLSITHPKAVSTIYGLGSRCTKAAWYDLTKPMVSLQTLRVKTLHDQRRRQWSSAFSDKALRGYEDRIQRYRDKLISQVQAFDGRPFDAAKWFNLYSFDVMGDLAFGTSFSMLETSEEHWAIKLLNEGIEPLAWMFPVWFFRVLTAMPLLTRDWWRFIEYCAQRLDERMGVKPSIPDVMSTLLSPSTGSEYEAKDLNMLRGDSQLIVVAGSDTTAATLTHIMLELARHPEHVAKLRDELAPHMPNPHTDALHQDIASLDHLNAVIYETLRLHPPVPTALQRKTPPEGIEIDGVHIPGDMTVWCPQYAIGRKEEIYTHATAFVPERWYLHPDMIKEKSAWAPFSAGPYGCIGRPLALMNIRTTVARVIMEFDVGFASGYEAVDFESRTKEHFTLCPPALMLSCKRRQHWGQ